MRKFFFACLAAATLTSGVAGVPAHAQEDALEAAQKSWEDAFNAGDGAAAAAAVFTEDARLLPPGEPMVVGRKAIGEYWQGGFDAGFHELELGGIAVETQGDTMIETGTWAVKGPDADGKETDYGGKALVIWKKGEDGVWRMSQDMWNDGQ